MRLPKWKGIAPRQRIEPLKRSATDASEGTAWLELFKTAIVAGKNEAEAIRLADEGAAAYARRFPASVPENPLTGGPK